MKKILLVFFINLSSYFVYAQETLLIYGGKEHKEFLGCLNCDNVASSSIWNNVGKYGSTVSSNSIWNEVGTYGGTISDYSPWNEVASNPPILVNKEGKFYGFFTRNQSLSQRAEFNFVLTLYNYYDIIKDDVAKWYYKLFN